MSSIVSALVAVFHALGREVYSVRGAKALLGLIIESSEFQQAVERLEELQNDPQASEATIGAQRQIVEDLSPLPSLAHPGHGWVIEIIYDDVSVANRATWQAAGFTPPKILILSPATRDSVRQEAINLMALGRSVVAANAAYVRLKDVEFNIRMASASWDRLMSKQVQQEEYKTRLAAKLRRLDDWKKRVADA